MKTRRMWCRWQLLWMLVLAGCGGHSGPQSPAAGGAEEKILNVYSWLDYIAPDTVANFEKETGIKVRYDMYDNNEVLETKLLTGHTNYDIVVPTGYFFERQRVAGVYRKLDKSELPNLSHADPGIMRMLAVYDPGNAYAIPYMFATTGLGYNVDQVQKRLGAAVPDGWGLLFNPENAAKLKDCGIAIVDSAMDVFESAMIYLGRDPNRLAAEDVAAASAALMKIRPYVRYIEPDQHIADLANGSICLALAWSGDVEQARRRAGEANTGARLAYFIPHEGAVITVDMMAIPADAPHPHNAELWMNYLMRPEVMASISNFIRYPNGYLGPHDPALYPTAETRERLIVPKAMPLDYSRLVTREWTRFRTGD